MTKCYPVEVDEYMTLKDAAAKIGYKDASGLHHAIKRGLLQTKRIGHMHVTTQEWLDAYVAHVEASRGGKGKSRPRKPPEEQP